MNNNIFPSHVIRTRNSDGSTTTSEIFSIEAIANQNLLVVFLCILAFALFAPYLAIIAALAVVVLSDEPKSAKLIALISVSFCVYLLYDIKHDWYGSMLIAGLSTPAEQVFTIKLTMAMLLLHSFYLCFSSILYELAFRNKLIFLGYSFLIWVVSYFVGIFILTHFITINFAK